MSLGENIVRLRTEQGLSQESLAEKLGVSRQSVSKWETDGSIPDLDKLIKLSEVFGISLDELVKGEGLTDELTLKETPEKGTERSEPPQRNGSRRAGYVYLVMGAVITVILALMGGALLGLIFGLPFYICTIICLTSKGKRAGLWCGWILFLLTDLYLRYATGLSWGIVFQTFRWTPRMNYMRLFIAWAQFLVMLIFILWTALSYGKEPWPAGKSWKRPFFMGCAGVACTTLLLWNFNLIMTRGQFYTGSLYYCLAFGRTAMDYCRMILVGWTAAQLVRFRRGKGEKEKETE